MQNEKQEAPGFPFRIPHFMSLYPSAAASQRMALGTKP